MFKKLFSTNQSVTRGGSGRVVGIDIGSSAIKVVEVEDRDRVLTLTTYGEVQLGPYDGQDIGTVLQLSPEQEYQALVDVLRESAVKADQAVFAIPLSASFITVISLDASSDEDLGPRIPVEARKYIPVPLADVTLDWAELPQGVDEGKRMILLAAIQNQALKRYELLMQRIGVTNSVTEVECFSALRSVGQIYEQPTAVIDIGAGVTKLYVVHKGILQRMHRIPKAGSACTSEISQLANITFAEAEQLKLDATAGSAQYNVVQKSTQNIYIRIMREFRQVITDYEKAFGEKISLITLTGSSCYVPGLETIITDTLQVPVDIIKPFDNVAYPVFMDDSLRKLGPAFAPALGAVLRQFL